jgi:acyl-CoA thioester hydrolase
MQVKPGRFLAGWADMDWNKHMANTAYLNKVVDARMLAFKDMGFSVERFLEMRIGFVVMKDEIDYRREVHWMDEITITFQVAGLATDYSRFKVKNEIFRADSELCARVTTIGGFMNLDTRKLVAPPDEVIAAYQLIPKSEDYVELPSSLKART